MPLFKILSLLWVWLLQFLCPCLEGGVTFLDSRRLILLPGWQWWVYAFRFCEIVGWRFCRARVGLQLISDEAQPMAVKCPQGFLSPAAYESVAGLLGCFGFYFLTSLVLTFVYDENTLAVYRQTCLCIWGLRKGHLKFYFRCHFYS